MVQLVQHQIRQLSSRSTQQMTIKILNQVECQSAEGSTIHRIRMALQAAMIRLAERTDGNRPGPASSCRAPGGTDHLLGLVCR